jgi:hypothetical protein
MKLQYLEDRILIDFAKRLILIMIVIITVIMIMTVIMIVIMIMIVIWREEINSGK